MNKQYLAFRCKQYYKVTLECVICHRTLRLPPVEAPDDPDEMCKIRQAAADAAGWIEHNGNYYCRRHAYNVPANV